VGVRARGVYYTPDFAARTMASWAVCGDTAAVLEPSVGDGVFLDALTDVASSRGLEFDVHGVELSREALGTVIDRNLLDRNLAIRADFLSVRPFPVDAVVGNPPYVRLRHVPTSEARRAIAVASRVLGERMDPSGSIWMPFVLHAVQFLVPGGRLALVLPHDVTYVRYARPLWRYLSRHFARLSLTRVRERLFHETLQETVLLFAEDFGGETGSVHFDTYETADDFIAGRKLDSSTLLIDDLVQGRRVFVEALLPRRLRDLLDHAVAAGTVPVGEIADIRIGYVTGDKEFFHPTPTDIARHKISSGSLRPVLTSSRGLGDQGPLTSTCAPQQLFWPATSLGRLSRGDREYIRHGEAEGIDQRYKCRVRKPWFVVPGIVVPDVVFPVFAERPVALLNDGGFPVSNSLLCAHLHEPGDAPRFVSAWYNSFAMLQMELHVHSLGGGVLVLVPREVSNMRVIKPALVDRATLRKLDRLLRGGDVARAYEWGDENVLAASIRLSASEVALIREGCEILAQWRRSASVQAVAA
jgi:hypothetical protein